MIKFREKTYSGSILRTNNPIFDKTRNYDQDMGRLGKHLGDLNKELRGGFLSELKKGKEDLEKERSKARKTNLLRELGQINNNLTDKRKWQSLD